MLKVFKYNIASKIFSLCIWLLFARKVKAGYGGKLMNNSIEQVNYEK